MTKYTLEYVRGLTAPEVAISWSEHKMLNTFSEQQCSKDKTSKNPSDCAPVVDRTALWERIKAVGSNYDLDLVELYVLGLANYSNLKKMNSGGQYFLDTELRVRQAVTDRVHELLSNRPELLHPNLRVPSGSDGAQSGLLFHLVDNRVVLDPDRLVSFTKQHGPGQEMLNLSMNGACDFAYSIFDEALKPSYGCATTATALQRACPDIDFFDDFNLNKLVDVCASGASAADWQFQSALELLRAVRSQQDRAGGDGHRIRIEGVYQPADVMSVTDFSLESSRRVHPVVSLIYETNIKASNYNIGQDYVMKDVLGFPGRQFDEMSRLINDVLEPECRLPLECLSGLDVLKLTSICNSTSYNNPIVAFWKSSPALFARACSPKNILNWALDKQDASGHLVFISELDELGEKLEPILTPGHLTEIRAGVVNREMALLISAATSATGASTSATSEAPSQIHAARRRSPAL